MARPVLDSVIQRASFAAVVLGADSRILEWNAGAERLFGFSSAEAVGREVTNLLGSKRNAQRKDGRRVSCLWQEEALDGGGVLAIVTDVTDSKTRERLLQVLLDNLAVIVWQVDTDGIFTFHDGKKGLAGIGMTAGQLLGQNIYDLYGAAGAEQTVRGALTGTPDHNVSDAHGMTWESWTLPLYDEDGKVDAAMGMTLDVSETRRRENELQTKLDLIENQQQTIRALSIPLIETWEGVLTVPMVGDVDTERASDIMEKLLTEITRRRAQFAIVDLTGVEQIDTTVAGHIIGLARSIKLLGAEGIVTGIRPSMAQAMVHLGADLSGIRTLANLREALAYCIARLRSSR